ncbi:MAG: hypothetical protein R3E66_07145 [bacterium]
MPSSWASAPNLFDCYLTPHADSPECNAAYIEEQLDIYHAKGVRVLFPNHKYDNAFTPGDGHRGIVEFGNFVTTGNYSNFVEDCPTDVQTTFDQGAVQFGETNRASSTLARRPWAHRVYDESTKDLLPICQPCANRRLRAIGAKTGLTDAGRALINGIMKRGMIPSSTTCHAARTKMCSRCYRPPITRLREPTATRISENSTSLVACRKLRFHGVLTLPTPGRLPSHFATTVTRLWPQEATPPRDLPSTSMALQL